MGTKRLFLAVACLLLLSGRAVAGWYHVENFTGTLGPYPIHLSLQFYASFGDGTDVEGSYFYDNKLIPIALYGTHRKDHLALCEISDPKSFHRIIIVGTTTPADAKGCTFALDVHDADVTGTWSSAGNSYPVALKRVATLDNTGDDGKIEGRVDIPFWAQTARHVFIGTYVKSDTQVCLAFVTVFDKKSKRPVQKLMFDEKDCTAGLLMTPIYLNLGEPFGNGSNGIEIDFDGGRMGHSEIYIFDAKKNGYVPAKGRRG